MNIFMDPIGAMDKKNKTVWYQNKNEIVIFILNNQR